MIAAPRTRVDAASAANATFRRMARPPIAAVFAHDGVNPKSPVRLRKGDKVDDEAEAFVVEVSVRAIQRGEG